MKILLLGEYSGLHWILAQGLISEGHSVTVASDGDGFKNYPRDIDFALKSNELKDKLTCLGSIFKNLNQLKGYDVVQIINPCFTRIHPINLHLFRFLKKHNDKVFLGAFGDDYYYVKMCMENEMLRYTEFYINGRPNLLRSNEDLKRAWINTYRGRANIEMAESCDGIIACLYEYYKSYDSEFKDKLAFIPLPVDVSKIEYTKQEIPEKVSFFIGINKLRAETKGSNIFYEALLEINNKYRNESNILKAESLPYPEYVHLMSDCNVVLDQIYSYSPAMNGLLAMAKGKVLVGGGEREMYDIIGEKGNYPIINILPTKESIYSELERLIHSKAELPRLSEASRLFVQQHHDHIAVCRQYLAFWSK